MDKKTKKALEASIRHWEENYNAEVPSQVSLGTRACALCGLFAKRVKLRGLQCSDKCPVKAVSGKDACKNTPYDKATDTLFDWYRRYRDYQPIAGSYDRWREAAQAEVDFLKSLRETEK